MKNIRLNPGGLIGAVLLLTAVIAITVLTADGDSLGRRVGRFGVVAVFVGLLAGITFGIVCFRRTSRQGFGSLRAGIHGRIWANGGLPLRVAPEIPLLYNGR